MHWYELDSNNRLTKRRNIQISIDNSRYQLIPKAEARPFLIDWNRDGIEDLVVSLQVAKKSNGRITPSSFSPKLFVKTGSSSRSNDTAKSLARGRAPQTPVNGFTPPGGADLVVALEPFDLGDEIEDRWGKLKSERWRVFAEFTFGDLDSDGTTDLIFSEQMVRLGIDEETGLQKVERRHTGLYWMKNTSLTGKPRFVDVQKIYDSDKAILSIASADFDQDGKLDIVVQTSTGVLNLLSQSQ